MTFFEGIGDAASFGLTGVIREAISPGSTCMVKQDGWYGAGGVTGFVAGSDN